MRELLIRKRLRFSGRVQGVGFRWRARHAANAVGATGWVRNERGGDVSLELQGSEAQIDRVLAALESAPYVHIEDLCSQSVPIEPEERGFSVLDDLW